MRIGVTGNYASGKGTVCSFFEKLGGIIIDTDLIAKDLVQPGTIVFNEIIDKFGNSFLLDDGNLNRRKFADYIFSDNHRTKILNNITHPVILEKTLSMSNLNDKIYFINAPLLFEAKFNNFMDKSILIKAETRQMIERGVQRDSITETEIIKRLNQQFSVKKKEELADYIIDNSRSLNDTKRQVDDLWKILITLLTRKINP